MELIPNQHLDEQPETPSEKSSNSFGPLQKELFEARVVLISAPIEPKLSAAVCAQLLALERANPKTPITLMINSPGGEIQSGFAIFDMVRFIQPEVITLVTGLAASMGSIISLAAKANNRYAFPNSKFLVHQPLIAGGLAGSATDIAIHAKDLIETKNRIIRLYCDETGKSHDEVKKALDRDTWLSAEQALEFGLIKKIVRSRADLPLL